jgi:prepilin-type N-terminal cleavage/methylation domain-containing protein
MAAMTYFPRLRAGEFAMHRRQGFTLVELLVSLALVIFLMTILSEAFVSAAKVFADFKAVGDLAGRLRTATQLLRGDLRAYHFSGSKRISDPSFWANGPPEQGFFRIWQQAASVQEGSSLTDLEGVPSFTSTGTWLHFTVNRRGNNLQDFFIADLSLVGSAASQLLGIPVATHANQLPEDPPLDSKYQDPTLTVYRSQWAEVAWFLKPNGATITTFSGGTPVTTTLYALYRRQLLTVQDSRSLNWGTEPGPPTGVQTGFDEISCLNTASTAMYFNDPHDLTIPDRRFGMTSGTSQGGIPTESDGSYPISPNGYVSSDVVATDVISFDVRVFLANQPSSSGPPDFQDIQTIITGAGSTNTVFGSSGTGVTINGTAGQKVYVYDTWSNVKDVTYDYSAWNSSTPSATTIPFRTYNGSDVQILAIQVSLRVWDFKTEQARQITLIVDM